MKLTGIYVSCAFSTLLAACVSPSQMLIGPQGDIHRCAANGWGYVGAPLAEHSVNNCINDFKNSGYLPVEEAGSVGVQLADSEKKVVVTVVTPNSPASRAGLMIGDAITKINGNPVLDRAAARTLMFGRAGDSVSIVVSRNGVEMPLTIQRAHRTIAAT